MRALVVGGNGFIGTHLVDRLAAAGWEVAVLDHRDRGHEPLPAGVRHYRAGLGNPERVAALEPAALESSVVFHLAWTSIHEGSNRDPLRDLLANVVPSLQLIDACVRASARALVFVSSGGTVYGPAQTVPIPENHPTNPRSAYGIHKLVVEHHIGLARQQHGLRYAVLRPSVAYGPRQDPRRRQGAVAVFLDRVASGAPVTIYGSDQISRDYLYVGDLIDALMSATRHCVGQGKGAGPGGPEGSSNPEAAPSAAHVGPSIQEAEAPVYNVGGPAEVSLRQLLQVIEETVGRTAHVEFAPARPFDAPRIVLDTRRARAELNWSPTTDLADGVRTTWAWMRDRT